jgi:hypothetical protein
VAGSVIVSGTTVTNGPTPVFRRSGHSPACSANPTDSFAVARATDEFFSLAPGFVSSTLHRSLDRTKVTVYVQWRSADDYESMHRNPGPLPFLEEALTIAKFEPGMYEMVRIFTPIER